MKTEWVTFDCYGTLIDWESGIRAFFRRIPGVKDTDAMLAEWEEIQFRMIAGPYKPYREILALSLRETLAARGIPPQPESEAKFADSLPTWHAFGDANPALMRLRAHGYKLGIISNIDDDLIARTLKHFHVPFDMVVTAQQSGAYKPNRASFDLALTKVGVAPSLVTHVAFGERYDLQTARDCGMQVVFVARHGRQIPFQPEATIPNLKHLPDLFD